LSLGLLNHLTEQALKASTPSHCRKQQRTMIGRQFLSAQVQERLKERVTNVQCLNVSVQEIVEELQKYHFEHEHWIPEVPSQSHVKIFKGRFNKGEVHGPGKIEEEVRAPLQQLVVNEVAEEETVGAVSYS
jgi:phenylalanyl-tRNA synthetase alpha subunit